VDPASVHFRVIVMSILRQLLNKILGILAPVWWGLAYFLFCGLLPFVLVWKSYDKGLSYMQLYSPLFLYPLFYGWIAVGFLQIAYERGVSSVLILEGRRLFFWAGVVAFALVVFLLEVMGPVVAVWEAPPVAINGDPFLRDFFETANHSQAEKIAYQEKLSVLVGGLANWRSWPTNRWAYFLSVFLQGMAMIAAFAACGVLASHRLSRNFGDGPTFRTALACAALAIAILFLWILMRVVFEQQRTNYYAIAPNVIALYVITGLFMIALLFIVACFWLWLGNNLGTVLGMLFGGVGGVIGLLQPSILAKFFGKEAGLAPHITILAGMALVAWVWMMLRPSIVLPHEE
jgi:hypothetical protein